MMNNETENKQVALNSEHGVDFSNTGFMIANTLQDALKISDIIAKSQVCPKQFANKPGDVLVAIQMGAELGLKPMQALQNIAVINGRPSLWGDAMLAVCRQSRQFEFIKEAYNEKDESYTCIVKRRNEPEFISKFSKADALRAKLWGRDTWQAYPKRMLQMRARGFALRDAFPDLLRGMITIEEARDYPTEKTDYSNAGTIIDVSAEEPELISDQQILQLIAKITNTESDERKICEMLKIESLEKMNIDQFQTIDKMLNKKLAKMQHKEIEPEDTTVSDYFGKEATATATSTTVKAAE